MNRFQGITLIELMIALALLAVLASFAIPSYDYLVTNNRITTQTNRLLSTLLYSRSEAAKRGVSVTACWSDNPAADPPVCGGGGGAGWKDGWVIFSDADQDNTFDAGVDEVIRRESAIGGGNTITVTNFTTYIRYFPDGRSGSNTGLSTGTFRFCNADNDNAYTRELIISSSGRPRVVTSGTCP